jgi:hypothetical protein
VIGGGCEEGHEPKYTPAASTDASFPVKIPVSEAAHSRNQCKSGLDQGSTGHNCGHAASSGPILARMLWTVCHLSRRPSVNAGEGPNGAWMDVMHDDRMVSISAGFSCLNLRSPVALVEQVLGGPSEWPRRWAGVFGRSEAAAVHYGRGNRFLTGAGRSSSVACSVQSQAVVAPMKKTLRSAGRPHPGISQLDGFIQSNHRIVPNP